MNKDIFPEKLSRVEYAISQGLGVASAAIRSTSRRREAIDARHAVWAIACLYLGFSYSRLKRLYNRTDHTTIRHGVLRVKGTRLERDAWNAVNDRFPGLVDPKS